MQGRLAVGSLFRASPVVGPACEILLLNSAFVRAGLGVDLARRECSPAHDANNRVKLNRSACAVLAGALLGLPHLLVLLAGVLNKKAAPVRRPLRCCVRRRRDGVCGPSADVASRFGGTVRFEGVAFAAGRRGAGDSDGEGEDGRGEGEEELVGHGGAP
jgi:hypothetical protein